MPSSHDAVLRLPLHVPDEPDDARLVAGPVCVELPLLARERPEPREPRREHERSARRDVGDELRPRLQPSPVRHLLLGRHSGRLRGQQRNAVAGLLLQLVVAVDDDAGRDTTSCPRQRCSIRSSRGRVSPARRSTRSRSTPRVDFAPGSKVCCTAADDRRPRSRRPWSSATTRTTGASVHSTQRATPASGTAGPTS